MRFFPAPGSAGVLEYVKVLGRINLSGVYLNGRFDNLLLGRAERRASEPMRFTTDSSTLAEIFYP